VSENHPKNARPAWRSAGRPKGTGSRYLRNGTTLDQRRLVFITLFMKAPDKPLRELYREAGFGPGCSDNTATVAALKLRNEPLVQREIRRRQELSARRTGLTLERHMDELAKVGHSDIRDFVGVFNAADPVAALEQMPNDMTAAVKSIKVKEIEGGRSIELMLWDKNDALKALAGHLGMRRSMGFFPGSEGQAQLDGGQRQQTMRAMLRALSPKQIAAWRDIVETLKAAGSTQGEGGQMIEHEEAEETEGDG
jgi:phage terminase small subunit